MGLKTTRRGSGISEPLPSSEALGQCMAIATTTEAADYFHDQLEVLFTKTGAIKKDSAKAMLKTAGDFRDTIYLQRGLNGEPWSGSMTAGNDFQNLQQNLAKKQTEKVASRIQGEEVVMDFAINDKAGFLRGYSVGGEELGKKDARTVEAVDDLFNAWLAENGMISQGSEIFVGDKQGNILKDEDGNQIPADAEQLKALMGGDEGFQHFMQDKGIQVTTRQQAYPGEEPAVQQTQAVQPVAAPKEIVVEAPDYDGVRPQSM